MLFRKSLCKYEFRLVSFNKGIVDLVISMDARSWDCPMSFVALVFAENFQDLCAESDLDFHVVTAHA